MKHYSVALSRCAPVCSCSPDTVYAHSHSAPCWVCICGAICIVYCPNFVLHCTYGLTSFYHTVHYKWYHCATVKIGLCAKLVLNLKWMLKMWVMCLLRKKKRCIIKSNRNSAAWLAELLICISNMWSYLTSVLQGLFFWPDNLSQPRCLLVNLRWSCEDMDIWQGTCCVLGCCEEEAKHSDCLSLLVAKSTASSATGNDRTRHRG